jgi:aminoglycoside phosphotransferase (APT) family kinase protein
MSAPERPPRTGLQRLVQTLAPGGRLVRMRRLRGGLSSRMHVLTIEDAEQRRFQVVLRRIGSERQDATYEFEVLKLLDRLGIAGARPLLLDAEGAYFGSPALVVSYIAAKPVFSAPDMEAWSDEVARALLEVHTVTPARFDLSLLHFRGLDDLAPEIEERRAEVGEAAPVAREVLAVMEAELSAIKPEAPCLIHNDFWPSNVLWRKGRVVAVVDWDDAAIGDPRSDVAQMRIDLVISLGLEAADRFLASYQKRAPQSLKDVWYFDLLRGLRALLFFEEWRWLEGYHDAGLTHLTAPECRQRIQAFLERTLRERDALKVSDGSRL